MNYSRALVFVLTLVLITSLVSETVAAADPASSASVADISNLLETSRAAAGIPAMSAIVLRGEMIIAHGVIGVRKTGDPTPATLNDRFHLGSDGKAMTATLLALLVEESRLRWDTTVGEVFAEKIPAMHDQWKGVTLDQLLAHRSGAPGSPDAVLWLSLQMRSGTPSEQRLQFVRGTISHAPASLPGTTFTYSNAGYAIAGAMAEVITGEAWEDLMQKRVFAPLGITTAGFGPPGISDKLDEPQGHSEKGRAMGVGPLADNPPAMGPAGTIHMTMPDWAHFIALHLRGDPANPNRHARMLKPATFAHLHAPPAGEEGYHAGWMMSQRGWAKGNRPADRGRVLTHSGSNTMWFCTTWLAPERDFAVLVACNRGGDKAAAACDQAVGALINAFKNEH